MAQRRDLALDALLNQLLKFAFQVNDGLGRIKLVGAEKAHEFVVIAINQGVDFLDTKITQVIEKVVH